MGTDKRKLDLDAAAAFLETVPRGRWTSYGDVAVAAGRGSNAAQGVVSWIGSNGHRVANVHRVLNVNGEVNPVVDTSWTRPSSQRIRGDRTTSARRRSVHTLAGRPIAAVARGGPLSVQERRGPESVEFVVRRKGP